MPDLAFGMALVTEFNAGEVDGAGLSISFERGPLRPRGRSTAARRGVPCGPFARFVPTDPNHAAVHTAAQYLRHRRRGRDPDLQGWSDTHFEGAVLTGNIARFLRGEQLDAGHTNRFIERACGKALLLDFNYDTEPATSRPW